MESIQVRVTRSGAASAGHRGRQVRGQQKIRICECPLTSWPRAGSCDGQQGRSPFEPGCHNDSQVRRRVTVRRRPRRATVRVAAVRVGSLGFETLWCASDSGSNSDSPCRLTRGHRDTSSCSLRCIGKPEISGSERTVTKPNDQPLPLPVEGQEHRNSLPVRVRSYWPWASRTAPGPVTVTDFR